MSLLETYYRWGGALRKAGPEREKTRFAVELACEEKWTLSEKDLFSQFYCGGVSHSLANSAILGLCPTIVGLKFPDLASDTKSISEAWQKLAKTETVRKLAKMRDQYNTFS